ncbi:MAG: hypothetical protein ACRD1T_09555, partial [Acidimicrobiia bacterium]
HDVVTGSKSVQEARDYYAQEFLDYRRKKPTPCMDKLRIESQSGNVDPDERALSDEDLERANEEGQESRQERGVSHGDQVRELRRSELRGDRAPVPEGGPMDKSACMRCGKELPGRRLKEVVHEEGRSRIRRLVCSNCLDQIMNVSSHVRGVVGTQKAAAAHIDQGAANGEHQSMGQRG